jgi:hypothetical protein
MKFEIKKIDGKNKCYIMANGDIVKFDDYKKYKEAKTAIVKPLTKKPETKRGKRS